MSLIKKEDQLTEDLLIMPDVFERMSYITDTAPLASVPEAFSSEEFKVNGCMAALHIQPSLEDNLWHFTPYTKAPMVAAVANLICKLYSGHRSEEITSHETEILQKTGIHRQLSPNRQNGAVNIEAKIKSFVKASS